MQTVGWPRKLRNPGRSLANGRKGPILGPRVTPNSPSVRLRLNGVRPPRSVGKKFTSASAPISAEGIHEKRTPTPLSVASNSLDMLANVEAVGSDLVFDGSVSSPTLLISEMTLSGR